MRWLKRVGTGFLALLVVATATGGAFEVRARHRAAQAFPPRGALIDIGGRRIHLDCRGTGAPVVVFESGLDTYGSLSWSGVQDAVAGITRACSYDRAGVMWSDRSTAARNGQAIASDLHQALEAAQVSPPYVLVGHSMGGPYAMTFTKRFGREVAGLVFVDASHPDQRRKLAEVAGQSVEQLPTELRIGAALVWTGLPRLLAPDVGQPNASEQDNAAMAAYAATSLPAMVDELAALDTTLSEAGTFRSLGDRPLVVLTAAAQRGDDELAALKLAREQGAQLQAAWLALQDDEARWSSHSQHLRLDDAHHYIQFDRPDAVVDAIRNVVTDVRAGIR